MMDLLKSLYQPLVDSYFQTNQTRNLNIQKNLQNNTIEFLHDFDPSKVGKLNPLFPCIHLRAVEPIQEESFFFFFLGFSTRIFYFF
jgi:hypothetical protein